MHDREFDDANYQYSRAERLAAEVADLQSRLREAEARAERLEGLLTTCGIEMGLCSGSCGFSERTKAVIHAATEGEEEV